MKPYRSLLTALIALAAATVALIATVSAATAAAATASTAAQRGTTIRLEKTSAGKLLTANNGFTLYQFSRDSRNKDQCVKINGCMAIWPPVTTKAKPVATKGVNAKLLGTIKLPNGSRQVTYAGHPLYKYSGDAGPRQTDYLGFNALGGTWHGVDAKGNRVG
jgi:predicted lipoprotein with Yx(FWY)xxD motif